MSVRLSAQQAMCELFNQPVQPALRCCLVAGEALNDDAGLAAHLED